MGTSLSGSTLSLPTVQNKRPSLFAPYLSTQTLNHNKLIDLSDLEVIPKSVRPLEVQLPHESRRLWDPVTSRLLKKEFGDATKEKVKIEQRQRDEADERKRKGHE